MSDKSKSVLLTNKQGIGLILMLIIIGLLTVFTVMAGVEDTDFTDYESIDDAIEDYGYDAVADAFEASEQGQDIGYSASEDSYTSGYEGNGDDDSSSGSGTTESAYLEDSDCYGGCADGGTIYQGGNEVADAGSVVPESFNGPVFDNFLSFEQAAAGVGGTSYGIVQNGEWVAGVQGDIYWGFEEGVVGTYPGWYVAEPSSFLARTKIRTTTGMKNIEDITKDDKMLGYDYKNNKVVIVSFKQMFVRTSDHYYELITATGKEIFVTAEHPLYTPIGYKRVRELKSGDTIFILQDDKIVPTTIKSLKRIEKEVTVYNLHVSDTNNYFAEGVLVKNKNHGGDGDGGGTGTGGGSGGGDDEPPCVSNADSSCNCNACGQCGGIVLCFGGCSGGTPGLPNGYGSSCGSCGRGTIQCDGSCSGDYSNCGSQGWQNTGSSCGNCGTQQRYCNGCDLTNSYQCVGQGVCSPGSTQCSGSTYQTCTSSCSWSNSGTDSDGDGVDQQCQDSTCDNAPGVCDTLVDGKCIAKTSTESACTDNLDNDCDGSIDCVDTDCAGTILGNVKNTNNENIDNARIDTLKGSTIQHTEYTQPSGNYQINNVLCGTYNIIASEPSYISSTKTNVNLPPQSSITVDFTGNDALVSGSTCEDDCTYSGDNIIHEECNNVNGCTFYDATAMEVCNFAQPGWIRDYNNIDPVNCPDGNCVIECADGIPEMRVGVKASITCKKENTIKLTKVIAYQGKLVKLIVITCG